MSNPDKAPVSIFIGTKDEERNIAECIKHLSWADEIIVFDSFSTDKTLQIAQEMGVKKIVQREFDDFATHWNWGLEHIDFKHEWILFIAPDERVTEALAAEIRALLQQRPKFNGYYIGRQIWFAGKWIRYGGWYPNWSLRLVRRGCGRFEHRIVHEHFLLDGPAGYLKNPLIHYDYKGIERYFGRQNTYSSMEAVEVYRLLSQRNHESLPAKLAARGPEQRRFLKNLAYRYLPARPLFKFVWMYILRLGFLDGRLGFRHCFLHAFYEYQINLKLEELGDPESPLYEKYRNYLQ